MLFDKLFDKTRNIIVTLRFSILSLFIISFVATIALVYVITQIRFKEMLLYSAFQLMESQSNAAAKELTSVMNPALIESHFTADLIKNHVLDPKNMQQIMNYTYRLLKVAPLLQNAYWGDENGNFIISTFTDDGTIDSEIYNRSHTPATRIIINRDYTGRIINQVSSNDLSYDPRVRPWYIKAKTAKEPVWSNIYLSQPDRHLNITAASPVLDNKQNLQGIFAIDIQLHNLVKFIETQKISPTGFSYIINTKGKMIAFPEKLVKTNQKTNQPILIADVKTLSAPWLTQSLEIYKKTKNTQFVVKYAHNAYLFNYKPIQILGKENWLIGVVVPEKDFTEDLEKMHRITYIICLIPFILGIIVLANLVTRIVKPINYLVFKTDQIKHFELDSEINIKSRIKEVINLTNAIRAMQKGLRSFQKYVPKTLVKQLIESEEDTRVGGVRKPLVVFFSDIKNFTAIAETIDPNQLMNQMCEYLEELTKIIIHERGTIDKYIGDSIMAFWGAPLPEVEPCHKAAAAALLCQIKLIELNKKWIAEEKPPLITRIGIHMGDAIIGNVGSTERLNYTAMGDTINMASRFESINKIYGTHIIVSDVVYQLIQNHFELRMLDYVSVRGRKDSNYIYELMATNKNEIPFDIDAYRKLFELGFVAYREQSWINGIKYFKQCIHIYPNDTVAPLFIKRCEYFKLYPPAKDWHGLWKIDEK